MLRFYEVDRPSFIELANITLVTVDPTSISEKEREALINSPNAGKCLQPRINPNAMSLIQKHFALKSIAQTNNGSKLGHHINGPGPS